MKPDLRMRIRDLNETRPDPRDGKRKVKRTLHATRLLGSADARRQTAVRRAGTADAREAVADSESILVLRILLEPW